MQSQQQLPAPAQEATPAIQAVPSRDRQATIGNAAVQQAQGLGPTAGQGTGPGLGTDPDAQALEQLRLHGPFGPQDITVPRDGNAATPGHGGFSASYDPAVDILTINLAANVNFIDGMTVQSGVLVADALAPDLVAHAARLNAAFTDPAERQRIADEHFHWDDTATWLTDFETAIESTWSLAHSITSTRPGWQDVSVLVVVDVQATAAGSGGHAAINAVKVPENGELAAETDPGVGPPDRSEIHQGAEVSHGTLGNARDGTMLLSSTDVRPRRDNLLQMSVYFEKDRAELTPRATGTLDTAINRYQDANRADKASVELVGRASSEGSVAHNQALAGRRIAAVRQYMQTGGLTHFSERVADNNQGEAGAQASEEWRRVDVVCDGGEAQVVAAHEAGHLFGLGDEYSTDGIAGTGAPTGNAARHDGLTQATGGGSSVHENNADIMSLGNQVGPRHFAPFVHALRQLTSEQSWVCR